MLETFDDLENLEIKPFKAGDGSPKINSLNEQKADGQRAGENNTSNRDTKLEKLDLPSARKADGRSIVEYFDDLGLGKSDTASTENGKLDLKEYDGNCHCGNFKFSLNIPELKNVEECDCSYCIRVCLQARSRSGKEAS